MSSMIEHEAIMQLYRFSDAKGCRILNPSLVESPAAVLSLAFDEIALFVWLQSGKLEGVLYCSCSAGVFQGFEALVVRSQGKSGWLVFHTDRRNVWINRLLRNSVFDDTFDEKGVRKKIFYSFVARYEEPREEEEKEA